MKIQKNKQSRKKTFLILIIASLITSILGTSISLAALPVVNQQPSQFPNLQLFQPLIPPSSTPNISCSGKVDSETPQPNHGDLYKVTWTIPVTGISSSYEYQISYTGNTNIIANTVYSTTSKPLPKPYKISSISYPLTSAETQKNINITVKLREYITAKILATATCSLDITNKNLPAPPAPPANPVNIPANPGIIINIAPVVKEIKPVPASGTNSTPSYTFFTTKAGIIKYYGTCSSNTSNALAGNNIIIFNQLNPKTYNNCGLTVTDSDNKISNLLAISSFTINPLNSAPDANSGNDNSSNNADSSNNDSSNFNNNSFNNSNSESNNDNSSGEINNNSNNNQNSETNNSSNNSENTSNTVNLLPTPDILTCKIKGKTLYFENDEPAHNQIGIQCSLKKTAIIKANIFDKSYDPKNAESAKNAIKSILLPKIQKNGNFYLTWNGYDDYDQPASLDDYKFVVEASLGSNYQSDISIQKFKVDNTPVIEVAPTTSTNNTTQATDNLHGAAESTIIASKCPGVNYPSDIEQSSAKEAIMQAYDLCIVKGYDDGTFKPNQNLSRAEATKIAVLVSGGTAKSDCSNRSCNSPFNDLEMWQGPWIAAAWDLKMVVGTGAGRFSPNKTISKAESASLITKTLKIQPHQGCYNPSCGAGYPDNIFVDVTEMWEGPYLRALWDKGIIDPAGNGIFRPDTPITRGEFIEIIMKGKK